MWFSKKRFKKLRFKSYSNPLASYQSEIVSLLSLSALVFFAVCLYSYNPADNTLFHYSSAKAGVTNWGGVIGANCASLLIYILGFAVFALLACLALPVYRRVGRDSFCSKPLSLSWISLLLVVCAGLASCYGSWLTAWRGGGLVGQTVCAGLAVSCGRVGMLIVLWTVFAVALIHIFGLSLSSCVKKIAQVLWSAVLVGARTSRRLAAHVIRSLYQQGKVWLAALKDRSVMAARTIEGEPEACRIPPKKAEKNGVFGDHSFWQFFEKKDAQKKAENQEVKAEKMTEPPVPSYTRFVNKKVFDLAFFIKTNEEIISRRHELPDLGPTFGLPNSVFMRNIFAPLFAGRSAYELMMEKKEKIIASRVSLLATFNLPDASLFVRRGSVDSHQQVLHEAEKCAQKLQEKLHHFGIRGRITGIKPGPIITLFEYQPEIDSKISKITSLEDDLAMALSAVSIRIIAPIPGKNAVGFEIANSFRQDVYFADVVRSEQFVKTSATLPLILGVDVSGVPVVYDLIKMPHLLIGGTTGSGKSVGLSGMIASLLCKQTPDNMRLILIDPKRLEFMPYADIPHLLFPIVTSPTQAPLVLKWVVQEMERRYELMAQVGVRSIEEYQRAVQNGAIDSEGRLCPTMPYMVVMIDELADLMIVAGKDIEIHIVRIAQMARASGISMIVATQRPSVDVVTGLIKVNFPSRIAFRVSSKVDSRTILDDRGAEKLLGRGDMLFMHSSSPVVQRIHGGYLSDDEISSLTSYLKKQRKPSYIDVKEALASVESNRMQEEMSDDLYPQIVEFLKANEEISISMIQRVYRIGFNRSARIIEQLELDGLIAPAQGSKPRKVLRHDQRS